LNGACRHDDAVRVRRRFEEQYAQPIHDTIDDERVRAFIAVSGWPLPWCVDRAVPAPFVLTLGRTGAPPELDGLVVNSGFEYRFVNEAFVGDEIVTTRLVRKVSSLRRENRHRGVRILVEVRHERVDGEMIAGGFRVGYVRSMGSL
jgi:hypothetical protein